MKMKNTVWMQVTKDKYELPVAIADSAGELAKLVGKTRGSIYALVERNSKGWVKVVLED